MQLSARLEPVIADLLSRNRVTKSRLRGGAFCAGIEFSPDGEPWVQVKTGVLNVFYPSDADPLTKLGDLVSLPSGTSCPAWEPWKYATLEFAPLDPLSTAQLIERLFVSFYDFPEDTDISTEVFDMR
jgi:hypothetical protein